MIWIQSLDGRAIDLLHPKVEDVDFWEIARTLARINRYSGASALPVSVALHTLIACDAAEEALKPWVLLHDAHEARIGDITTPVEMALRVLVVQAAGEHAAAKARAGVPALKRRHDVVIHAAAGLMLPDSPQKIAIRVADLRALVTERRDFLAPAPQPWADEVEAAEPLERRYDVEGCQIPDLVARRLFERFQTYLPALAETKSAAGARAKGEIHA